MAAWCPSSKSTPPARTSARGSSCFGRNSNSALRIPREAKRWPMAERCRAMSRWRGKRYLRAPNWPDLDRKQLFWKEFKLCLAHPKGSKTLAYGGTLQGDVAMAGQALFACAELAGFGRGTQVHAVGDGATWIADQVEDQFGAQGSYLLDFYHVCDYLSAAAKAIVADAQGQARWMDEQKARLKTQRADELLKILLEHIEAPQVDDADAPVRGVGALK